MPAEVTAEIKPDELRVLVVPPTRADAAALNKLLGAANLDCHCFADVSEFCDALVQGVGVALLSEESLISDLDRIAECIRDQPVWSDVPIIVLSRAGAESAQLTYAVRSVGNASVIERPVRATTLVSLIRSALRARERQYQVRAQLIERERTAQAIREGERRYRLVIENITDYAIFMMDLKGKVTGWNEGAEQILGYTAAEIMGKPGDILYTPEDRGARIPAEEICKAISSGRATDVRWHLCKDGRRLFMDGVMTAVHDDEGKLIGLSKVMKDITERHRIEVEREQLFESEREARAEAERAGRMKDEFLATLSHELRTPLNAILGWSQMLRAVPGLPEDADEGLSIIERNARAQTQIIEDLLDMSRIISGKVHMDVQRLELKPILAAAIETVRPAAQLKGVKLQLDVDNPSICVQGDPSRLQQVFWNLLTNAVKFTPRGGQVTVTLACDAANIEVSIADTGEGIGPEFLPHVFDRFRQADASTTRRHGGLGLGLSIVKQLVELHGGTIAASSEGAQRGAVFTVRLPVAGAAALAVPSNAPREESQLAVQAIALTPGELNGLKILVVDDEPDARALLRRVLEASHARVLTASSAPEAIDLLIREHPDLLISDIGMPEEDGYALIRQVRSLECDNGGCTPAIALTAYARAEDRVKALDSGFQFHMSKPVEPAELVSTITRLVRQ